MPKVHLNQVWKKLKDPDSKKNGPVYLEFDLWP